MHPAKCPPQIRLRVLGEAFGYSSKGQVIHNNEVRDGDGMGWNLACPVGSGWINGWDQWVISPQQKHHL